MSSQNNHFFSIFNYNFTCTIVLYIEAFLSAWYTRIFKNLHFHRRQVWGACGDNFYNNDLAKSALPLFPLRKTILKNRPKKPQAGEALFLGV